MNKQKLYSGVEYLFKHKTGRFTGYIACIDQSGLMQIKILSTLTYGYTNMINYEAGDIRYLNIDNVEIEKVYAPPGPRRLLII